jgi:hypothetical protein
VKQKKRRYKMHRKLQTTVSVTLLLKGNLFLLSGFETARRNGGCAGTDTAVSKGVATAATATATATD